MLHMQQIQTSRIRMDRQEAYILRYLAETLGACLDLTEQHPGTTPNNRHTSADNHHSNAATLSDVVQ